ncbi:MAG: hypothetical protein KF841_09045 [Phycisphaerae bacterium]|nr:hypothetical protein [Phycisphaerae bacterium]
MKIAGYDTIEYPIPIAGRTFRLLGPRDPWSLFTEPGNVKRNRADGYSPYWSTPWPGAVMLAEYVIAHHPADEEPILELGAGLGLAGLALSAFGHRVVITDYDRDALQFVQASADLNDIELFEVRPVDWRKPPPAVFRMILGADVLYEKDHQIGVLGLLRSCLHHRGAAILADQNRAIADDVIESARGFGFSTEITPVKCRAIQRPDEIDGRILRGRIFTCRRSDYSGGSRGQPSEESRPPLH